MEIVAIFHNIRSAHNVGSMFRTADGAGLYKLYLCGVTPLPVDRFGRVRADIAKVALGAEREIPWEYCGSTTRLIDRLIKDGFSIIVLEQHRRSIPYDTFLPKKREKLALVVGNEVGGLSPAILRRADTILEIPMAGRKESLNVSVAFGIAVYALTRA